MMEKPFSESAVAGDFSRLNSLYPYTDLSELPFCWSNKDKANFISLSDDNLKVHYKGNGKNNKDAASVRTSIPIPSSCLLYYFEIKVLSKGRDGYMGIGLAAQGANMQRLPGWDKQSYGYHGDDGNSFCSSGTGQPYGPIFTTNDVIGCGYNIVENNCFFTKNGHNLGIAFTDLPNIPLYPTIGLQTPGEKVTANFGLEPFCYDIEDDLRALRQRITSNIINHPVKYTEWQSAINKLVLSWLIHNSYCSTAEVFSSVTKQEFKENVQQIKQRLRIQQLVLAGKIEDAIQLTNKLYPDVLNDNPNLLFALKCRQFVEMISESCGKKTIQPLTSSSSSTTLSSSELISNKSITNTSGDFKSSSDSTCTTKTITKTQSVANNNNATNPSSSSSSSSSSLTKTAHPSNLICSPSSSSNLPFSSSSSTDFSPSSTNMTSNLETTSNKNNINNNNNLNTTTNNSVNNCKSNDADAITANYNNNLNTNTINATSNNSNNNITTTNGLTTSDCNGNSFSDKMDIDHDDEPEDEESSSSNNINSSTSTITNNNKLHSNTSISCTDEISKIEDDPVAENNSNLDDASRLSMLINFGRELHKLSKQLKKKSGSNDQNKKMLLQVSSLMAYSDPTKSPIAWQLNPSEREHVCQQLNNAIVMSELGGCNYRPPLESIVKHTKSLLKLNGQCGAWLLDQL
ncbi:ran-binding protein 10-like [Panonychus citri]|uniref:ran-binding protein 10-like n=1 Tax=Panonychus citri TaxID=50023 RepID=UPI002307AF80|nr:ran-binding protein 10-like [Panonychus citri]XP_053207513.1 ran-binding protein 10-like [Panonychus citri]XP_053207514.1 ran-binding protein 10-like [Panonychus citri]XP_053207515.1 ran-binding protein 10-like [Panonychus citri]XP_053207516.1 ran-binding protein 10-like [Panonychus citri]XP_053207517.1 ran-binding protein 10-like [Panonychus citri]